MMFGLDDLGFGQQGSHLEDRNHRQEPDEQEEEPGMILEEGVL